MVDVEQRTLCAFGQYVFAFREGLVDFDLRVGDGEAAQIVDAFEPCAFFVRDVEVREAHVGEQTQVAFFQRVVFREEIAFDVAHAQTHASRLVTIGGADALTGRAHFVFALRRFVGAVEHAVRGQNEVSAAADMQAVGDGIARGLQFVRLGHEQVGRNDATVADQIQFTGIEDARGDRTEHKFLSVEDDGVAGIGAAGKARHQVVARSEIIDDLAFAFVAEHDAQQGIYLTFCHGAVGGIGAARIAHREIMITLPQSYAFLSARAKKSLYICAIIQLDFIQYDDYS